MSELPERQAETAHEHWGERLRREAQQSRPEFSEALHARILAALPRAEQAPIRSPLADRGLRAGRAAVYAAIAAAAALIAVVGWRAMDVAPQHDGAKSPLPHDTAPPDAVAVASVEAPLPEFSGWSGRAAEGVDALLDVSQPADALADDLQTVAQSLLDRLPLDMVKAEALAADER